MNRILDPFEWTEETLRKIEIDPELFESLTYEFKVDGNENMVELRKDIIAFANGTETGYIIYGIADDPLKICGLDRNEVDKIKNLINNTLLTLVDPIFSPFPEFKPISISNGKFILIVKITPKISGIYGIRTGENPSDQKYFRYEFWVRMDARNREFKWIK
jgi:predicted HTH transcriptional regulator